MNHESKPPDPQVRPDVDVCPRCADSGTTVPVHAHTRVKTRYGFRCPIDGHGWTVDRRPEELRPLRSREQLDKARTSLRFASEALEYWHDGPSTPSPSGRPCATYGADALARIDEALAAVHAARASLVAEIRHDEDLSGTRVDAMLAARRKQREAGQ